MDESNLKDKIKSLAAELLGSSFVFRPGQLDAIAKIVSNATSNVKHTVLEAPTGSGKSMVAVISAYALYRLHKKKSYILVSDLSLYDQYERDLSKLDHSVFGCVKGKENYVCCVNGCKVSQSDCALKGYSVGAVQREKYRFPCKYNCKYIKDYSKAVAAPITLMTYQLYFIQRNYVEDCLMDGKNKNFPARDLVICDECHKICDICQAHFAPIVSIARPHWMDVLDKYALLHANEQYRRHVVDNIAYASSNEEMLHYVSCYEGYVARYAGLNESIRSKLADKRRLSKADRVALLAGNTARQEHCKLEDMLSFLASSGSPDYAVRTISDDKESVTLNFIFDSIMLQKYFHNKSKNELLMSATIGNFNRYAELAGLDKKSTSGISMASTFDFSRSPIYVSSKNKMSYNFKDTSFLKIINQVVEICRDKASCRGIIQTGSYKNAKMLMEALPNDVLDRCMFYNSTVEKGKMLENFMHCRPNDNRILIGPTLLEGLNFPEDMCRFQICIKVPYASLASEYVRKKMEYVTGWYEYDVLNKLCQGIGRGVRSEHDWCETYILDGCIFNLLNQLKGFSVLDGRFKQI